MTFIIDIALLTFLAVVAVAIVRVRNLLAVTMLTGLYSFLAASLFFLLDAVDVALTEAAVGAGIMTILMLATLALTTTKEKAHSASHNWLAMVVVAITGAALIYGTQDMPGYADPSAPAHNHVAPYYINQSYDDIGIPNIVTSVLASYRGLDTFGETVVIFSAAVGVLLMLGSGRRRRKRNGPGKEGATE